MKKSILFLSFLLFAALFARGSDTKEVRLTFDGSDFSFAQENGAYSISAEKFPVIYDTDTLAPALPYYVVNVLIAPTQEFQGLTVRGGESLLRSDIRVTPNKLPVPTNALDAYTPNRVLTMRRVTIRRRRFAMYPLMCLATTSTSRYWFVLCATMHKIIRFT